jgi:hypothetical protein
VFIVYNKEIVRPQELVFDVEKKYEKEEMRKSLLSKTETVKPKSDTDQTKDVFVPNKPKSKKAEKQTKSKEPEYTAEQLEAFMKILKTMNVST